MKLISRLIVPLAWGAMTACSGPAEFQTAPVSQKDVGFLIQGTKLETQNVINQSSQFRVISPKHNIYEVKGLSLEQIKNLAPQIQVEQNQYQDDMIQSSLSQKNSAQSYETFLASNTTSQANALNIPPALIGCDLDNIKRPSPRVTVLSDALATSPTMSLGETLSLSGETSFSTKENPEVKIRWDVITPALSNLKENLSIGQTLNFTPDSVGFFQVALVVEDSEKACAALMIKFLVTHNPEIADIDLSQEKPTLDLKPFSHLDKVSAARAWDSSTGENIIVAVLDTGLNYNHRAIQYNLAFNDKERGLKADNDNDDNGFKNDDLGWDFVNGDNRPFDDEGHGSHVSGLSSSHIFGLAKNSKVMPLKVLNAAGGGDVGSVIAGIYYAADNGARVINASLQRLNTQVDALQKAIEYAGSKGVIFVSSAGNDGLDLSLPGIDIFPGEVQATNVINVAATGANNLITSYSNFGSNQVHVAAPGGDQTEAIYSLATMNAHNQAFVGSGGTSMAAPIVSGIAALVLSINPNLGPEEVKNLIIESGQEIEELKSFVGSSKIVDANLATQEAQASVILAF